MDASRRSQGTGDEPAAIQGWIENQSVLKAIKGSPGRDRISARGRRCMSHSAYHGSFFDQTRVCRIHVIGGAGSGKTTLARTLGARLDLPVYHLDEIYLEHGSQAESLLDLLFADIRRIAAQSAWITEGIYLWWTDELLRTADAIIWLDIPWRHAAWRLIVRYVWMGLKTPSSQSALHKLRKLIDYLCNEILWSERKYYLDNSIMDPGTLHDANAKNRATTAQYLAPYSDKLVRCRTYAEIESFLTGIRQEANV
jgi:adenylate kinase family enzyme